MRNKSTYIYILFDLVAAAAAWSCFYLFRKMYNEGLPFSWGLFDNLRYKQGVVIISICWIILHALADSYKSVYRMSRLTEIIRTGYVSLIGCLVIFFGLVLDDLYVIGDMFLVSFLVLFGLQFCLTLVMRITGWMVAKYRISHRKVHFNTLLLGSGRAAKEIYDEINGLKRPLGYKFLGYMGRNGASQSYFDIPYLGTLDELSKTIQELQVEEVILALDTKDHERLKSVINVLYTNDVIIKIVPDIYDILIGSVHTDNVIDALLVEVKPPKMAIWQRVLKRLIDVFSSAVALAALAPLMLFCAIRTKLSSPGPIFFTQERIGKNGKPFFIVKFRSMRQDAEAAGPQLSSDHDPRVTPWGRVMRKYRFDELPQFWNVLKGEMSLVGPRPERQHFIDQLLPRAPHVLHLLKVRPGITSWGQVKFGYASNVNEMIQRLRYDIVYVENQSLALDLKILFYTVVVVLQGRGK